MFTGTRDVQQWNLRLHRTPSDTICGRRKCPGCCGSLPARDGAISLPYRRHGAFDTAALRAVRSLKLQYPRREISLRLILPSMRYVPKPEYMFLYEDLYDEILVCEASDGAHFKAMIGIRTDG